MRLGGAWGARLGPQQCPCVYKERLPLSASSQHVVGISGCRGNGQLGFSGAFQCLISEECRMSVWTPQPRSTPRHREANINVHVLCHRDFIRCFLCNCISRTTVMKMPQRTNEMNCEISPSRRRWPPPDCGVPTPASSKALVTFLDR